MPDEKAKIILAATNAKLTKVRDTLLVEDNINSIKCRFVFRTSDWDNTRKTAVFVRGHATPHTSKDNMIPILLDANNECNIPYKALADSGEFSVGVWGTAANYRITSNWMYYKVADGCFTDGGDSSEPTQGAYEQILMMMNDYNNLDIVTHSEVDAIVAESVSKVLSDILSDGALDAGSIIEGG